MSKGKVGLGNVRPVTGGRRAESWRAEGLSFARAPRPFGSTARARAWIGLSIGQRALMESDLIMIRYFQTH